MTDAANSPNVHALLAGILDDARILNNASELLDATARPSSHAMIPALLRLHHHAEEVQKAVVSDSRFPGERVFLICSENGGTGFYPNFFGVPFVRRLLRTGDPGGTIRWLQKVLATISATGRSITALWGVPVEDDVELTDEVVLSQSNSFRTACINAESRTSSSKARTVRL
jgi:hypothetical protein